MRRLVALAVCLGGLCVLCAIPAEAKEPERAFVDVTVSHERVYVGQRFRVTLSFGYEVEHFRQHAAPLFRQETDVPVHLKAPWIDELPGARGLATSFIGSSGKPVRLAVNDRVIEVFVAGEITRDGRTFGVLQLLSDFAAQRAGELVLSPSTARYVHADRFEEDFVGGRVPIEPRDVIVEGADTTLQVLALPKEGRPESFGGAVGSFEIGALTDTRTATVGESFTLQLVLNGIGTLPDFPAPLLTGFHVLGTSERPASDDGFDGTASREIDCEIAPTRSDLTEIPAISFTFFDPGPPAGYRSVASKPIPLTVHAAPGAGPAPDEKDEQPAPAVSLWLRLLIVIGSALVGVGLIWLSGLKHRARKRAALQVDPDLARALEASTALRAQVAQPGAGFTDAYAEFLAAHLRCSHAAVIAPSLAARLAEAGVPTALAARAAAAMEGLVAARYGSGDVLTGAGAHTLDAALVDDLEAVLRPPSREGP